MWNTNRYNRMWASKLCGIWRPLVTLIYIYGNLLNSNDYLYCKGNRATVSSGTATLIGNILVDIHLKFVWRGVSTPIAVTWPLWSLNTEQVICLWSRVLLLRGWDDNWGPIPAVKSLLYASMRDRSLRSAMTLNEDKPLKPRPRTIFRLHR